MKRNKLSRVLACTMAVAMAASSFTTAPKASAASGKYVKSLKIKKKVTLSVGSDVTVKPVVKVVKKATKKLKVKVKDKKLVKVTYNAQKQVIKIKGKKAGKTTVTVTTKGKNKKGKKLSAKISVNVTAAAGTTASASPAASAETPATPVPSNTVITVPTQTPEPTHYAEVNLKGNVVDAYAQNGIYSVDDLESYSVSLKNRKKTLQVEKPLKEAAAAANRYGVRREKAIRAEKRLKRAAADIQKKSGDVSEGNLRDAQVYLIPNTNNQIDVDNLPSTAIKTATDANGDYEFEKVSSGNYCLVIQKDDYKPAIQFITLNDLQPDYQMEAMYVLNETIAAAVQGQITGTIVDATNKEPIKGLTVELRHNKGNTFGDAYMTTTTDADGVYTFGGDDAWLEADQYTVYVKDQRKLDSEEDTHYLANIMNTCVYTNAPTSLDIAMTKPVSSGDSGLRFVLQWGNEGWDGVPADLDSHLYGPRAIPTKENENEMFHIYFSSKNYGIGDQIYANLDVDDLDYEGPETVTLVKETEGIYYYYVYNYSETESLARSQATVKVYAGDRAEPLTVYNVPSSNNNELWWKVCSYNSKTHELISYNVLEEENSLYSANPDGEYGFHLGYEVVGLDADDAITVDNAKDLGNYYISSQFSEAGIYVYGYVSWNTMKEEIHFNPLPGYTVSFEPADGIDSAYRGDVVLTDANGDSYRYPLHYYYYISDEYEIQVEGDALARSSYYSYGPTGDLSLYLAVDSEADLEEIVKNLKFTYTGENIVCGDITFEYAEGGYGEAYLSLLEAESGDFMTEVYMYIYAERYLSSVTYEGENVNFYEGRYVIELNNSDTDIDLKEFSYHCANGYTADVVYYDDYDDCYLQIKDSAGKVVAEKSLYLYWDDYEDY